jgi:hypothetical protein
MKPQALKSLRCYRPMGGAPEHVKESRAERIDSISRARAHFLTVTMLPTNVTKECRIQ